MRAKKALALILFVVLGVIVWYQVPADGEHGEIGEPVPMAALYKSPVLGVPPERMREALDEAYRLRPDSRFLQALAHVDRLLSAEPAGDAQLVHTNGGWSVQHDGEALGTLPEIPDLPDFMSLLVRRADRLGASRSGDGDSVDTNVLRSGDADIESFEAPRIFDALIRLASMGDDASLSPPALRQAARAYALLCLQVPKRAGQTDPLFAKAMAVLAVARSRGAFTPDAIEEECLLAAAMHYDAHASRLADRLDPRSAIRCYLLHDDAALEHAAGSGSRLAEYLWLVRLTEKPLAEEWEAAYERISERVRSPMSAAATGLDLGEFEFHREWPPRLQRMVLVEMRALSFNRTFRGWLQFGLPSATLNAGGRADRFEKHVAYLSGTLRGPLLDPESFRAYYSGHFYSYLHTEGNFYARLLASIPATREFVSELGDPVGTAGMELKAWHEISVDFQEHPTNANIGAMVRGLARFDHLDAEVFDQCIEYASSRIANNENLGRALARAWLHRLDSRPDQIGKYGNLLFRLLSDVGRAESAYERSVVLAPWRHRYTKLWFAWREGDSSQLLKIMQAPETSDWNRANAVEWMLKPMNWSDDVVEEIARNLAPSNKDSTDMQLSFAEGLINAGRYTRAREVLLEWLATHDSGEGFDYIIAREHLCSTYYYEKDYQRAYDEIVPVVGSWREPSLLWAALCLAQLKRYDEAVRIAEDAVDRYPMSVWSWGTLMEVRWMQGEPEAIPRRIPAIPETLGWWTWRQQLAPRFARVFAGKPPDEMLKALEALLATGTMRPGTISLLAAALDARGDTRLAFEVTDRFLQKGQKEIGVLLHAYRLKRALVGQRQAIAWLKEQTPPRWEEWFGEMLILMRYEHPDPPYELLWEITDPAKSERAGWIWLMRAAASRMTDSSKDPYRDRLMAGLSASSTDYYTRLARFVVGLETEADVLPLATDAGKRCEVAYYAGLRAHYEDRMLDANDWYRVAVETGVGNYFEHKWASKTLVELNAADMSLSRIEREGMPPVVVPLAPQ